MIRDALAIALVTGATDAVAFTRPGGTFTSVMTGNSFPLLMSMTSRSPSVSMPSSKPVSDGIHDIDLNVYGMEI
jgi:hypothetical protein